MPSPRATASSASFTAIKISARVRSRSSHKARASCDGVTQTRSSGHDQLPVGRKCHQIVVHLCSYVGFFAGHFVTRLLFSYISPGHPSFLTSFMVREVLQVTSALQASVRFPSSCRSFLFCFHQHRGMILVTTCVFINIVAWRKATFFLHVFSTTSWH